MTRHIAILGIDGSGKSTVAQGLPAILSAEHGLTVGAAGARFQVVAPEKDLLAGPLAEGGRPWTLRLTGYFRGAAKRVSSIGWLYVVCKLLHMMLQDRTARALGRRYEAQLFISEGNTLLCAMGRAMNYLAPARKSARKGQAAQVEYLGALVRFLREGGRAPKGLIPAFWAHLGRGVYRALRAIGLDALWVPEQLVFLDVSVEAALLRISSRGQPLDRHENVRDMTQARESYLAALELVKSSFPGVEVIVLKPGDQSAADTLFAVKQALRGHQVRAPQKAQHTLGTTEDTRTWTKLLARVVNPRYLAYQVRHLRSGSWREPLFLLSAGGRQLLDEGYSANTMAAIYAQDEGPSSAGERIFLEYPLHRAVYDRLHVLVPCLAGIISRELETKGRVRIFTAPSGHAEDVFRALEKIASRRPVSGVELVAADLDPDGRVGVLLSERAERLGVKLHFRKCDLTTQEGSRFAEAHGPYELALFVGLSSWLPKPAMRAHLSWLSGVLTKGGLLVSDCFSAAPYAISGALAGYAASYFTKEDYASFVCDAGFQREGTAVGSGRDLINHVLLFAPRSTYAEPRQAA